MRARPGSTRAADAAAAIAALAGPRPQSAVRRGAASPRARPRAAGRLRALPRRAALHATIAPRTTPGPARSSPRSSNIRSRSATATTTPTISSPPATTVAVIDFQDLRLGPGLLRPRLPALGADARCPGCRETTAGRRDRALRRPGAGPRPGRALRAALAGAPAARLEGLRHLRAGDHPAPGRALPAVPAAGARARTAPADGLRSSTGASGRVLEARCGAVC